MWNWINSTLSNICSCPQIPLEQWGLIIALIFNLESCHMFAWYTVYWAITWLGLHVLIAKEKYSFQKKIIKPDIEQLKVREKLDAWSTHSHLLMVLACAYKWRLTFIYHRSRAFSNIHVYLQSLTWPWFFQEF